MYESVLGSIVGYTMIRSLHGIQMSRSGFAGIGLGDAKYLAALAAWFGWRSIPLFLAGGALVTLVIYPTRINKPFGVGLGILALSLFVFHYSQI